MQGKHNYFDALAEEAEALVRIGNMERLYDLAGTFRRSECAMRRKIDESITWKGHRW
jgi:hypothetical protein